MRISQSSLGTSHRDDDDGLEKLRQYTFRENPKLICSARGHTREAQVILARCVRPWTA